MYSLVVTTAIGIEDVTRKEIEALGLPVTFQTKGALGVETNDFSDIYRLNYLLRTATRVLLHLKTFPCRNERDLYAGAAQVAWEDFFPRDIPFAIETSGVRTTISNSLYAAQVVKDAICDRMRKVHQFRPSVDTKNPKMRFFLHLDNKNGHLSFDTSGRPLHERGWRKEVPLASLRENLAAALVMMAEPTENDVIVDPCAGSGTLLIEALMYLMNVPPQYLRKEFAFYFHPQFRPGPWEKIRAEAMNRKKHVAPNKQFLASEIDPKTFKLLEKNIQSLGFEGYFEIECEDFCHASFSKKPTMLLSNMPYGVRLGDEEALKPLYRDMGDYMKQKMQLPARGFILGTNELIKSVGLKTAKRVVIINGGIECRFAMFDVYGQKKDLAEGTAQQ